MKQEFYVAIPMYVDFSLFGPVASVSHKYVEVGIARFIKTIPKMTSSFARRPANFQPVHSVRFLSLCFRHCSWFITTKNNSVKMMRDDRWEMTDEVPVVAAWWSVLLCAFLLWFVFCSCTCLFLILYFQSIPFVGLTGFAVVFRKLGAGASRWFCHRDGWDNDDFFGRAG